MVYVLNRDGEPLMPTERLGRVRRLLKEQKAIVKYNGQDCYVNGRRASGYFSLVDIYGKVLTDSVSYKKLHRINHNNYIIGDAIPLTH